MNKKIAIVSNAIPQICNKLESLGFKLIYTQSVGEFISYEQKHADMQCLKVENKVFVLSGCQKLGEQLLIEGADVEYTSDFYCGKYPDNIKLNALVLGKKIIGKTEHLDKKLVKFCEDNDYRFINVKQGYSACSCAKVNDNSIITADKSIYDSCLRLNIDVLKIKEGFIKLDGAEEHTYGFIGGASVNLGDTMLFFGDITEHPDYKSISEFCNSKGIRVDYIKNLDLTDIGSTTLLIISQSEGRH